MQSFRDVLPIPLFFHYSQMFKTQMKLLPKTKPKNWHTINLPYSILILCLCLFYSCDISYLTKEVADLNSYGEIGVGTTQLFNQNKWAIGFRAKMLFGIAYYSITDDLDVGLNINPNNGHWTIQPSEVTIRSSENFLTEHNAAISDPLDFINSNNIGVGMQFAATYFMDQHWTFDLTISDIGFIDWKNEITEQRWINTEEFIYTGLEDIRNLDNIEEQVNESFEDVFIMSENKTQFREKLIPRSYLSASYTFLDKKNVSLSLYSVHYDQNPDYAYSIGLSDKSKKLKYAFFLKKETFDERIGFESSLAYTFGPFQLFLAGGKFEFKNIERQRRLSFQIGLNLEINKLDEEKEEVAEEVEAVEEILDEVIIEDHTLSSDLEKIA